MIFHSTLAIAFAALVLTAQVSHAAGQTFFPNQDLAQFLVLKLDLATFRNALGPRRTETRRTFAELGIAATQAQPDAVVLETEDWQFRLKVLRRTDINRDGLEDLALCFTEEARRGSYFAQQALLVTRFSHSSYAVALKYEIEDCKSTTGQR
ncbi:MAG: hypothetical protein ACKOWC_04080 [Limnohabitans sp.]